MYRNNPIVKLLPLALLALALCLIPAPVAAEDKPAPKPHMMYFYNPSCRLCTKTNEIVGAVENRYEGTMSHQRFNISDPNEGTDNVLYMFQLMDELQVPEEDNVTLVVFLGLLEQEGEEVFFTPVRVLVEGDEIIGKLEKEAEDFLAKEGKGGSLGATRPAAFFRGDDSLCLAHRS